MTAADQTLEETIKRLQDHAWIGDPARRMGELHAVIAALLERQTLILAAIEETITEIEYWHADMLTEHEREHPRGSGWARVYDKLAAARDILKGRAA
jgi:hypothetical protein